MINSDNDQNLRVEFSIFEDWVKILCQRLLDQGYELEDELTTDQKLMAYFTVKWREIPTKIRKLHFSKEFTCPDEYRDGLLMLESESNSGDNLSLRQSRKFKELHYTDRLLADWGIQHLHLGISLNSKGLIKGTEHILFCVIDENNIYCINIRSHNHTKNPFVWVKYDMLEIIENNWPHLFSGRILKGTNIYPALTEEEYFKFREINVISGVQLSSGSICMAIGGGVMTDGSSSNARINLNQHAQVIHSIEKQNSIASLINQVRQESNYVGNTMRIRMKDDKSRFIIYEEFSGVMLGELS